MRYILRMVTVCIGSYLKSVLRYKFLILDTYHPDSIHLCQQECEAKRGPRAKCLGSSGLVAVRLWFRLQDVHFEILFPASGFIA